MTAMTLILIVLFSPFDFFQKSKNTLTILNHIDYDYTGKK